MRHSITVFGQRVDDNLNIDSIVALANSEVNQYLALGGRGQDIWEAEHNSIIHHLGRERLTLFKFLGACRPASVNYYWHCYKAELLTAAEMHNIYYPPAKYFSIEVEELKENLPPEPSKISVDPEPTPLSVHFINWVVWLSAIITPVALLFHFDLIKLTAF